MASQQPKIDKISPLTADEAKWTELRKIDWTDQTGRQRVWEAAARKTRKSSGVDAVAIAPILRHPNKPPSTLIILQYRPPVEAICVEFPAGLIDEGETPEEAAVRELKEETGYQGKVSSISPTLSNQPGMTNATHQVLDCSPTIVSDPGLTTANMQMVTIEVNLKEGDKEPEQHLDEGEFIERRIVPLSELYSTLHEPQKPVAATPLPWIKATGSQHRFLGSMAAIGLGFCGGTGGYALIAPDLPLINEDLGPSPNITWVGIVYVLSEAVFFALVGKLSDIFGRRWFFIIGSLVGVLGSIVGATAKDINTLIGSEVLIGISAAFQISFFWVISELVPMRWRYLANSYAYMITIPTNPLAAKIAFTFQKTGL
ncbi:hypothetical protein LTR62_008287 [Meristemomyces frigidus]|uniref:Nudix hydrolase domain-containing protein n=1 Tax=Meristemomyces frigidus TaxID=1508187 RepID=A0AAN7TDM8_9PEZI|nr:hypothetical protein LTR62_008287 [Meristemomyces frigidus]